MSDRVRTDAEARDRWRSVLQQSLSCVHPTAQLFTAPPDSGPDDHVVLGCYDDPIALRTRSGRSVYIHFSQLGVPVPDPRQPGQRKIRTLKYSYQLLDPGDPQHELMSWHWHPDSGHPRTHLHTALRRLPAAGDKLHIPTGRVSFEEVLLFLIEEFEVELAPGHRRTGLATLNRNHELFLQHRTWHGSSPGGAR